MEKRQKNFVCCSSIQQKKQNATVISKKKIYLKRGTTPNLSEQIMKKIFLTITFLLGSNFLWAQEIAIWSGFRNGVATFTFDDNLPNQLTIAVPIFDKYGYKASFYIVNNWSPNYSKYKELVERGYEIGSHSDTHSQTMPDNEIASSKKTIESRIPNQSCNTIIS